MTSLSTLIGSELKREKRNGMNVSVEGSQLKLTPLDKFVLPLPLSLTQFEGKSFVRCFTFCNRFAFFVDETNELRVLKYSFPDELSELKGNGAHNWGTFTRGTSLQL